jgi:hypothetical protein
MGYVNAKGGGVSWAREENGVWNILSSGKKRGLLFAVNLRFLDIYTFLT